MSGCILALVNFQYLIAGITVNLLPVLAFLLALVLMDSFKLVKPRSVLMAVLAGCGAALVSYVLNLQLAQHLGVDLRVLSKYLAPVIEEVMKAAYVVFLIRSRRVGFMVDAAIIGFAVGAGFAIVENVYYLDFSGPTNPLKWVVRGFGTAVMHGSATALFGIITQSWTEKQESAGPHIYLPGLALAIVLHSLYNHFYVSPMISTLLIIVIIPLIMVLVFHRSESGLRHWLGVGFDADQEFLRMISSGEFGASRTGRYLQSLRTHFPPEVVADMFCLLRLHVELSIRAKGMLLLRQSGFELPYDPEIKEKFEELKYLERSIGGTGKLALKPVLKQSRRELWQLTMLNES
jgi:RsiW-degrading membrane proteinase PrsW (M82 family)